MLGIRERLEGARAWRVWEKQEASRNPWQVPEIALRLSYKQSRDNVPDLGV